MSGSAKALAVQLGDNLADPSQNLLIRANRPQDGTFLISRGTAENPGIDLLRIDSNNNLQLMRPDTGLIMPDGSKFESNLYGRSFRNKIINGDFFLSQYNVDTAVTPTGTGGYVVDRWNANISQASKLTFQRVTDAPAGSKYSYKATVAAQYAPVAADYFHLSQAIEGINIVDLQWGSAGALYITTSFKVKASVPGVYTGFIKNGAANRTYLFTYTITQANTWTPLVLAIAGCTDSTWAIDNTVGMYLSFCLGAGANYTGATTGQWVAGNLVKAANTIDFVNQAVNSTWQIADVQLEPGKLQMPVLERLIPEDKIKRCRRYYQKSFDIDILPANGSTAARFSTSKGLYSGIFDRPSAGLVGPGMTDDATGFSSAQTAGNYISFKEVMRAAPTIGFKGNSAGSWWFSSSAGNTGWWSVTEAWPTQNGMTVGFSSVLAVDLIALAWGHWTASAEL